MKSTTIVCLCLFFIAGALAGGYAWGIRNTRCEAVDHGAASYSNTDQYGNTAFNWHNAAAAPAIVETKNNVAYIR